MGDQADVTVAPAHNDLCADVAACLDRPVVAMTVAPAGGAGHVAYEVFDPAHPGAPVAFYRCESGFGWRYGLRREAEILPIAAVLGWPVPLVLGTPGNPPGLLMNVIPGTSRPDPDETESTAAEYLALVAAVHAADPAAFPIEQYATMGEAISDDLGWWTAYADERGSLEEPLIRLAARVLAATVPATDERPSLVHGDVGAGNFMVDGGRVSAMLDWELAHVGDPMEDLGWICVNPWRFGMVDKPVGGFGERDDLYDGYEAASGARIDRAHVRFWEVLGALKWGVMCAGMTAAFRAGDPSVERAVIARRASEAGAGPRTCPRSSST